MQKIDAQLGEKDRRYLRSGNHKAIIPKIPKVVNYIFVLADNWK
jgi:hypothetical protein